MKLTKSGTREKWKYSNVNESKINWVYFKLHLFFKWISSYKLEINLNLIFTCKFCSDLTFPLKKIQLCSAIVIVEGKNKRLLWQEHLHMYILICRMIYSLDPTLHFFYKLFPSLSAAYCITHFSCMCAYVFPFLVGFWSGQIYPLPILHGLKSMSIERDDEISEASHE